MSDKILLGKGLHKSKSNNNLIITLLADARIGQSVADKNGQPIGNIFDIFGPVETPFASIKLHDGVDLGKATKKPVFLKTYTSKKTRRDKKRRRSR